MAKHLEVVTPRRTPPVWAALRNQAEHAAKDEPALASLLNAVILSHDNLADALTFQLARKLGDQEMRAMTAREFAADAFRAIRPDRRRRGRPHGGVRARSGLQGLCPAVPVLQGLPGLQTHRVSHWLWNEGRETLAFYLQSRASEVFQVDINPPPASARACSSTTAPASSSARRRWSATTSRCCTA
jgi:serine O-acetyltransferase